MLIYDELDHLRFPSMTPYDVHVIRGQHHSLRMFLAGNTHQRPIDGCTSDGLGGRRQVSFLILPGVGCQTSMKEHEMGKLPLSKAF